MATTEVNSILKTQDAEGNLKEHYLATKTALIKDAGQPGGAATLDANGDLEQMPTLLQVGGSRENILINHNLKAPINQRGQTVYSGAIYGIDGWRGYQASQITTLTADGIQLEIANISADYLNIFNQWLEYPERYSGKALTVSALITILSGGCACSITDSGGSTGAISTELGGPQLLSTTKVISSTNTTLRAHISAHGVVGTTVRLIVHAVKLELGDNQTLAHQDNEGNWVLNDPPPNPQQELAKCQRYFETFRVWYYGRLVIMVAADATNAYGVIPISPKRADPAIAYLEGDVTKLYLNQGGTYIPLTSLEFVQMHNNYIFIKVQVASGLTANASYVLRSKEAAVVIALDSSL